ncbi:HEPN domain-containing protein [Ochrobactrum vermis]|uniref:HEPN domain-containing protein n=1 Tax=Ochrobactrum vermis TaxID=1827297 RepID=A0ABU8PFQ3_9HYPH|nr:HEPN domain-containing protein [Ochrobactrum vermis]PQZ30578.1 nucleotidyltransferase [Ochrobactrum vermis]
MTLPEHLGHFPESKRRELERIVRNLFDEFEDAQKSKLSEKKKNGRILKLVLFVPYRSEYNLLVVVTPETSADPRFWYRAEERFLRELTITRHLATPVNFIVHSIMDVNNQLALGLPFFVDIARDGILLYEAPGFPFASPKPLDPEAARAEMHRHLEHWFPSAAHRFELAKEAMGRGYHREAAFDLHQTVERLYHCTLHVLTLYRPKSHRLTFLRTHAEQVAPQLMDVWPSDSRFAARCFARLERAYVEARYSHHYKITGEELAWLAERVKELQETTAAICAAHLNGFDRAGMWKPSLTMTIRLP